MSWLEVVNAVLALAGADAKLVSQADRPWHSATFSGRKHTLTIDFEGPEAVAQGEALLAELPFHEFSFRRHLLADACVVWSRRQPAPAPRLTTQIELLLLDDPAKATA